MLQCYCNITEMFRTIWRRIHTAENITFQQYCSVIATLLEYSALLVLCDTFFILSCKYIGTLNMIMFLFNSQMDGFTFDLIECLPSSVASWLRAARNIAASY